MTDKRILKMIFAYFSIFILVLLMLAIIFDNYKKHNKKYGYYYIKEHDHYLGKFYFVECKGNSKFSELFDYRDDAEKYIENIRNHSLEYADKHWKKELSTRKIKKGINGRFYMSKEIDEELLKFYEENFE